MPKRRRPPGRARRRSLSPRDPRGAERAYALALKRVAVAVREAVAVALADFRREPPDLPPKDGVRLDASPRVLAAAAKAAAAVRAARSALARLGTWVADAARRVGARVADHAVRELARLGLKPKPEAEPDHGPTVERWRKATEERVRKAAEDQIERAAKAVERAVDEGRAPAEAAAEADEVAAKTDRRLDLTASDDVLTLNAQVVAKQAAAAGSPGYVWTSMGDDRVRPKHEDLDGQEFTWESGGDPDEGHPGEPPNCRCRAFPIAPEEGPDT